MTKLSDILPKKEYCISKVDGLPLYPCCKAHELYNNTIDECHTALEQAMKDGVICFVPSIGELRTLILQSNLNGNDVTEKLAKAILQLLKKGNQ